MGRIIGAGALVVATVILWFALVFHALSQHIARPEVHSLTLVIVVLLAITLLLFSSVTFLITRLAAMLRILGHTRATREELDTHFDGNEPGLTILVPSYAEEPRVVRNTILSAALQEFPNLRVVLLLDDPPNPSDSVAAERLEQTRLLVPKLAETLAEKRSWIEGALYIFEAMGEPSPEPDDIRDLATLYEDAAHWLQRLATGMRREDHADAFLANGVMHGLVRDRCASEFANHFRVSILLIWSGSMSESVKEKHAWQQARIHRPSLV
ncbi:MAG: glycosyltransferase family 2 protein, partial [Actinobacteria bacterium]|nr:glycosyltransferase family 2 protein [Actinomycetota bacterium]